MKKYKDTIGYVPFSISKKNTFNILKVNGIYPSIENVISKKYVLISPLGIVWKGKLEGKNKKFIDFLFSPAAQKIMLEYGTVPVVREKRIKP
ncbi:MAG: hypothetical protein HY738_16570 [Bacteroidia bacterium]|nr:hypothetical protein [Bacteroidia bacterium]